jgi:TetR/AcrR family fatty acid metabolism transcriptional regulator
MKVTKRQLQAQNTKEKIYQTAVELMNNKGLNNITVEEVCRQAGVSIGSFYNCFKSKNDIMNEIYQAADEYFLQSVAPNIKEGTLEQKIRKYFSCYAQYNMERGIEFMKNLYNVHNTMFIKKGRHMQLVLLELITKAQSEGEIIGDMSPEEIVDYLFIAARGIVYDWCLHDGSYDLVEFTDRYFARLIKTFCAEPKNN